MTKLRRLTHLATVLAVLVPGRTAMPATPAESGVASAFARSALNRISAEPLTIDGLEGALILLNEAVKLDPDSAEIWNMLLNVATLAERDEPRNRAIERLARLDPANEWIRFLRLNMAIDGYQTVAERVAAYEKMLSDENVAKLGPAVASRLALDLALLQKRQGDVEQFSKRLSQAVALDSANRSAAALAAGFFRMNVKDPFAEAELLVNLMLADPTDVTAQVALGQLLLENGAYTGANRVYQITLHCARAAGTSTPNDLLADAAIAQWAAGDVDGALEAIRKRQSDVDIRYRNNYRRRFPDTSAIELAKISGPVDTTLATVRAVINQNRGKELAATAYEGALAAYQSRIDALKKEQPEAAGDAPPAADAADPSDDKKAQLATLYLQMAWVAVWLGNDMQKVADCLIAAEEHQPLSDDAKTRFEGCVALRRGDPAKAIAMLEPLAARDDVAARVGLGLALLEQGEKKQAAQQLLAANRAQPGSLIGIWASGKLGELLGQRLPLSDVAKKLEQLISSIPAPFDRYPEDSSQVLTLRLQPGALDYRPYEPVTYEIELTNNSLFPFALDKDGPVRPQILITPIVRVASEAKLGELRPFVVDIDRKLRLMPREKVTVSFDLRNHHTAEALNEMALDGVIVRLKAYINFAAGSEGDIAPSLYGAEVEGPIIRIDGVRVQPGWMEEVMRAMQNPAAPGVVRQMALLSHKIAPAFAPDTTEADRKAIDEARTAFAAAFGQLDGTSQAWLLCTMADGEGMEPTLSVARKSENRLAQFAYLLYRSSSLRDPMLDAAKRKTDDPPLQRLAEVIEADAKRALEAPRNP